MIKPAKINHFPGAPLTGMGPLASDRLSRVILVALALAALPFILPVFSGRGVTIYGEHLVEPPFLLLLLWLLSNRAAHAREPGEAWFWRLWWVGFLGWLVGVAVAPIADPLMSFSPLLHDTVSQLPYLLLYGGLILALELQPGTRADSIPYKLRLIGWGGSFVFLLCMLFYFLVLPDLLLGKDGLWTYTLSLFVALDSYILLRLWHLYGLAATREWRQVYFWLLTGAGLWTVGDLAYALMVRDLLPDPGWGTLLDMLWPACFVAVAFATRVLTPPPMRDSDLVNRRRPLGMGPLVILLITPLSLHVSIYHFGTPDPLLLPMRDSLVLASTAVLAGLAMMYHRRLRATNRCLMAEEIDTRKRLAHLAFHDELTGLPNRNLFRDRLSVALAEARRNGTRCGVLFCDLDNFKVINDSLGHEAGDQVLVEAATRLQDTMREQDTVARLGGDEFAIIVQGMQQSLDGASLAEKLLSRLAQPMSVSNKNHVLHASVGIAVFPDDGRDEDTLLKHADTAMYQAKLHGKNSYRLFTQAMNEAADERLSIEQGLRSGLMEDRFTVFYQPIVDLHSGRTISHEALLRWNHPERGYVAPVNFIEVAEQTGLIVELGLWVLNSACHWAAAQDDASTVSVNISQRQLRDANFVGELRYILATSGLAAERLQLEISESMALPGEHTADTLVMLRELGVLIAIDDFGTGYAALGRLQELSVDVIKIDRSFVTGVEPGSVSEAIILAIVNMARALGFSVIAEGVETEAQLELVRQCGCEAAQGYLLCAPLPPAELPTGTLQ